jgi:uncharacterized protein with PIN domain
MDGLAISTTLRFYAELNELLAPRHRGRTVVYGAKPHQTLKHAIEALGLPHTEVALLLVNGQRAAFDQRMRDGDRISVYPVFRTLDSEERAVESGRTAQAPPTFIADAQLARLARLLRFAGYDTLYRNAWEDAALVGLARAEQRSVLSRDRALLMHRDVASGSYVREDDPRLQLRELAARLRLDLTAERPVRCIACNAALRPVAKAEVAERLPPRTREHFEAFWSCRGCERIYWRGSHWKRMRDTIEEAAAPPRRGESAPRLVR